MKHAINGGTHVRGAAALRSLLLLAAVLAGCSTQGRYSPPERTAPCAGSQTICTGNGSRIKSANWICHCAALAD